MVMADRALVLNEPLCFLIGKLSKLPLNVLKSAACDFYDNNALAEAKSRLLDDVNNLSLTDGLPHIPKRREGANRSAREVDDLLLILSTIDEHGQLNNLPRYVAASPDSMPSLRLFDGDMQLLLSRLDKMECKLVELTSALATINGEVHNQRSRPARYQAQQALSTPTTSMHEAAAVNVNIDLPGSLGPTTNPADVAMSGNSLQSQAQAMVNNTTNPVINRPTFSWAVASVAAASTPIADRVTTADNPYSGGNHSDTAGDQPFIEYQSRKKRRRQNSLQQEKRLTPAATNNAAPSRTTRKGQSLLVGKRNVAHPTTSLRNITAARPLIKKAVFCIDNVDTSVTLEDMHEFVTGLSVQIVSLFEAKPRQRNRTKSTPDDIACKAFRLCINEEHRDRLLVDSQWPAYVTVSEWYFKTGSSAQPIQSTAVRVPAVGLIHPDNMVAETTLVEMLNDPESTIVMTDHSQRDNISVA